jgi:hypothetical protein
VSAHAHARAQIDAAYAAWKATTATHATRGGQRYPVAAVARLLAPPLAELGLRVYFADDRGHGEELVVTAAGRHMGLQRLAAFLAQALADHPDAALRDAAGSLGVLRELRSHLPAATTPPSAYDRAPARPALVAEATREHFAAFVAESLQPVEGTRSAFERYQADACRAGVAPMGAKAFHRAMRESGAVVRKHTRRGDVYRKA